jgi:hypothetical protein
MAGCGLVSFAAAQTRILVTWRLSNAAHAVPIFAAWNCQPGVPAEAARGEFAAGGNPARKRAVSFGEAPGAALTTAKFVVTSSATITAKANSFRTRCSKPATQDAIQHITGGVFHMAQTNATSHDPGCDMRWNLGTWTPIPDERMRVYCLMAGPKF